MATAPAFAEVALPVPLDGAFTYSVPEALAGAHALQPGVRVRAPWGARTLSGVVVALRESAPEGFPLDRIRPLHEVIEEEPALDAVVLAMVRWTASYYQAPLGEVMRCALPPGWDKPARRRRAAALSRPAWEPRPRITDLNPSQRAALAAIADESTRTPLLLHGVTGSGKTAVYLAAIEAALARGESALLLVPEIGLTPALFADFEAAFPDLVAVLHSGLGEAERARHWKRLRAGEARVAIGTRSAVFAPVQRLGLILVDEEHDGSFKQQ
ncbi:MAG: DEAD/DEAH box helicase, partial [Terriglobales bacterium]